MISVWAVTEISENLGDDAYLGVMPWSKVGVSGKGYGGVVAGVLDEL